LKKLTYDNKIEFFDQIFGIGEICQYDENYFLYKDIKKLAKTFGLEIEYISSIKYPELYKKFGCFSFKIISGIVVKESVEAISFDPAELDI
jgi:hypothetical protein